MTTTELKTTGRTDLPALLDRWVRQGLITPQQAQRIAAAEHLGPPGPAPAPPQPPRGGNLAVEALGYLGGLLAAVAALILIGMYWEDLSTAARLAVPGAAAVVLLAAGAFVGGGMTEREAPGRLRAVLWLLAVVATGAFLGVLGDQSLDLRPRDTWLLVGIGSTVVAGTLFLRNRGVLQHIALFGALSATAGALGARADWDEPTIIGLAVWTLAVAWFAVGERGWIGPAHTARYVGAVGAVIGGQAMTGSVGGNLLALATVAALFVLGVTLDSLALLGIAAWSVIQTVPQSVSYFFEGEVAAPIALLVTGSLLVGVAVAIARRAGRKAQGAPELPAPRQAAERPEGQPSERSRE